MGHDTAKYMCVDSKLGVHDRDRLMVAREPSGTLRHMTEEERERLNQIYFPKPGRRIKPPVLFEIENLEKVHCSKFKKKIIICSLSDLCSPRLIFTRQSC